MSAHSASVRWRDVAYCREATRTSSKASHAVSISGRLCLDPASAGGVKETMPSDDLHHQRANEAALAVARASALAAAEEAACARLAISCATSPATADEDRSVL